MDKTLMGVNDVAKLLNVDCRKLWEMLYQTTILDDDKYFIKLEYTYMVRIPDGVDYIKMLLGGE